MSSTNSRLNKRPPRSHQPAEPTDRAAEILFALLGPTVNVLTPEILRRELVAPNVAVELSRGLVGGKPLFGVAVVVRHADGSVSGRTRSTAEPPVIGGAFHSAEEAVAHIATMRRHLKKEAL